MKLLKKHSLVILSIAMSLLIGVYFIIENYHHGRNEIVAPIRVVHFSENEIDYQAILNEFEDAELLIDENKNRLKFSGTQILSADLFEEIDFVSLTEKQEGVDVGYIFDYFADSNEFYLSVIADYTGIFYGKCVITTKQLVDMTGTLTAVGNGHVLIRPVAGDMAAWIATKNTADVAPHPYSVALKQIVIRIA